MYSRGYCKFFRPTWVWDSSNTWLETRSLKEEAIVLLHPMNRLQGHSGQIFMDKCRQFKEHPSFNLRLPSLQPWSLYLKAWHANVLSRGSECLSDHPRWMFKKNSMEFFVGLQSYLYYYYSGCTLKSHDHLLFPECSMVTWPFQNVLWSCDFGLLSSYPAFYSVVYLGVWNAWGTFFLLEVLTTPDTKLLISWKPLNIIVCFNDYHKALFNVLLSAINKTRGNKI